MTNWYNRGIHCPEPSLDPPEWSDDEEEVDEEEQRQIMEDMAFEEARERAAGWLD